MSNRKARAMRHFVKDETVLYHYTSKEHVEKIMSDGFLKLTCSNVLMPDGTAAKEKLCAEYKPVVWLTDSLSSKDMGVDGSFFDKTEIRIIVKKKDSMIKWSDWEPQKTMNTKWKNDLCRNCNWESWYISEEPVQMEDILKIENLTTKKTIYQAEKNDNE